MWLRCLCGFYVAHAILRAAFALMRTLGASNDQAIRKRVSLVAVPLLCTTRPQFFPNPRRFQNRSSQGLSIHPVQGSQRDLQPLALHNALPCNFLFASLPESKKSLYKNPNPLCPGRRPHILHAEKRIPSHSVSRSIPIARARKRGYNEHPAT